MDNADEWKVPRRQSKVYLLLLLVKLFKQLWPLVLLLLAKVIFTGGGITSNRSNTILWFFAGGFGIYLLSQIVHFTHYFFFRFCIVDDNLIINSGAFVKSKTIISTSQIQAIHTTQNLLHKLTNTCKLVIDTAGTENAEVKIEALNIQVAKDFQLALANPYDVASHPTYTIDKPVTDSEKIIQLSYKDLLKLCISENHIKTFLIIVAFVVGKMQDIKEYFGFNSFDWMQRHSSTAMVSVKIILQLFIAAVILSVLVSGISVWVRYYKYTIHLLPKDFVVNWGLFNTQRRRIPFTKVQLLSWRATFLRRMLGMYLLRLHATTEDESKDAQLIKVPVTSVQHLQTIINYYQPKLPSLHHSFFNIQKKYITRQLLLVGLPVSAALAVIPYFAGSWYTVLIPVWLCYFAMATYLYWKNFKIWISNEAIQIEDGVWGRKNILINFSSIQQVAICSSPYKRRHQLANVVIYTPGTPITIPFLKKDDAAFLANYILANIEFEKEIAAARMVI